MGTVHSTPPESVADNTVVFEIMKLWKTSDCFCCVDRRTCSYVYLVKGSEQSIIKYLDAETTIDLVDYTSITSIKLLSRCNYVFTTNTGYTVMVRITGKSTIDAKVIKNPEVVAAPPPVYEDNTVTNPLLDTDDS